MKTKNLIFTQIFFVIILFGFMWFRETYQYRFHKNNKYIDDIKLILILDKDAVIKSMGCRTTRKYSFDIMTKPILKKDIIELFEQHGWRSKSEYSFTNIKKGEIRIYFSSHPETLEKLSVIIGY